MSNEPQHIVHKLILEVETNSKEKGYALKENASGFVAGSLSPVLEELFEELEKKLNGSVLTLDRLSVNVSAGSTDLTYGDIDRLIGSAIRKEMEVRIPQASESILEERSKKANQGINSATNEQSLSDSNQLVPVTKRHLQAVFHFLKTGTRPWWIPDNASLSKIMETAKLLELARTETEILVRELHSGHTESFLNRMFRQLPESVLIEWFTRAFQFPEILPDQLAPVSLTLPQGELKQKWWKMLFRAWEEYRTRGMISPERTEMLFATLAASPELNPEPILRFVQAITGKAVSMQREQVEQVLQDSRKKKTVSEEVQTSQPDKQVPEPEAVVFHTPVEHAGLILLHPFLNPFFTEIGLLEGNQLTDPELAVHVLHYLATGQENAWEFELQFEKFLCGIPVDEPIQQTLSLSDEMKEEAGKLLDAVLEHWTALRSDSAELLRLEFLQREAKIIQEEFQSTRLVFERKAQDILLEKLPWNLGIVKIDWQKDLLFVEW